MMTSLCRTFFAVLAVAGFFANGVVAQTGDTASQPSSANSEGEKFSVLLFWRSNDAATQIINQTLRREIANRSDRAVLSTVKVDDPAQQSIVNQYGMSRAPMPFVLIVASNGAVTGAYPSSINAQQIDQSLVSPTMAECMKHLQQRKIVLVTVRPEPDAPTPGGVAQFLSDPAYSQRSAHVQLLSADPEETATVQQLGITSEEANGCVVMMAPPAVFVGKFPINVSGNALSAKLHEAGKCCNDKNCKHHNHR